MFPPRFDYVAPQSVNEVLSLLAEHGDDAKVLAGGQSLIPLMKFRFASPKLVVDINNVPGLDGIEERDGVLHIGARARHNQIGDSPVIAAGWPLIAACAPLVADPIVRNLGTIGGSLVHADPGGDWGTAMLALNAEVVARSTGGERTIAVSDLFEGTYTTALRPDELLTEIRIPKPTGPSGGTYLKLERKVGDFATAAAAVQLELSNGSIKRAGIALTAVGPTNVRATAAEDSLAGAEPTDAAFAEAARLAAEVADPATDTRGSAEYKKEIARVYVQRGLATALAMARG
jgi:aerobic carbon-monoxide dehydrogenase medium subunit